MLSLGAVQNLETAFCGKLLHALIISLSWAQEELEYQAVCVAKTPGGKGSWLCRQYGVRGSESLPLAALQAGSLNPSSLELSFPNWGC